MAVPLPALCVGDPLRHEALAVFPLFAEVEGHVPYRLSHEALADQQILVREVTQGGSVPNLLVENQGDTRVLFLEGEELVGAKQNRILNTSVLVAAHSKIQIPVSCVEQGRWQYTSRFFGSSGAHSPSKVRRALKGSVSRSVRENLGHQSDQSEIWSEVASLSTIHGVHSGTHAMSDVFASYHECIAAYCDKLKYVEGAIGLAVAIGDRILTVDVFDKPATCQKVWERLLSGVVFDAIEAGQSEKVIAVADVEQFLAAAGELRWEKSNAVGEGEEFRAESEQGDQASALSLDDTVVHGSVVTAM